jgi:aminoglycoside phosphotransferase (APT) family kinase protein
MTHIQYYITFAYFKLAVICQQIYYRYSIGQTKDPRFSRMDKFVYALVHQAMKGTA